MTHRELTMPELRRIPLRDIDEPTLPVRVSMDEEKLRELCESMSSIGLLNPISLVPRDERYEIEAGHRRFMAARQLKWFDIPALIFQPHEIATGAAMLAENVVREDITAAEEAVLFAQHMDKYNLDEAGLVARFHRSPDYIGDRLRLLRADQDVFNALLERKINFSVARELNKCDDQPQRFYFLDAAIRAQVGARVVAQWVSDWRASRPGVPTPALPPEPAAVAQDMPSTEIACALCGGSRDPFNLTSIYIHKWELAEIRRVMKLQAEEQTT